MDHFKEKFSEIFELPEEVILNTPLVMMVGKKKIYLENHQGVSLYQTDLIKIKLKSGLFVIKGKKLEIDEIDKRNLFISGNISALNYENGGGPGSD